MATKKKSEPIYGRVRTALEATIAELNAIGRLGTLDSARVEIARVLADVIDLVEPSAILWREYRAAEKALREETNANQDPFDELLRNLQAPLRDEKEPKEPHPRG